MQKFRKIKLDQVWFPRHGHICYEPSWWIISPDREISFTYGGTPQCNTEKTIILPLMHEVGYTQEYLPMLFIPPELLGYVDE